MKNILLWLRSKYPVYKSREEIIKMITDHEAETVKAEMTVDRILEVMQQATLDGEEGWWCKFIANEDKECKNVNRNHSTT